MYALKNNSSSSGRIREIFPFYHPHDAMDCGSACLQMIACAYGCKYSLN
ncbi:MAG: hypothetical protein LBJ23_02780 [Tannerella sp.]|nr:hypothetical protein [Tannerella sp.]